jgi:hypothetical protein
VRLLAVALLPLAACQFDASGVSVTSMPQGSVDAAPDAAPPAFCDPADDTLVACYRFEAEHAEQPYDESAFGNHGTATDVTFAAGPDGGGQALVTRAGSSVRVPDSASLDVAGPLTLELWVRPRALPAGDRAGLLDNNGQYGLFLSGQGEIRCAMSATVLVGLRVPAGAWTHVACAYDGERVTLYQDGVAGPSSRASAPLVTDRADGLGLAQNSPSGENLDGAIDQVRIWRARRSDAQICAAAGC